MATLTRAASRRGFWTMARREALEGYFYIAPFLLGFLIFTAYPTLASLYLSFTKYNIIQPPDWIGLENYAEAFGKDRLFWSSLEKTGRFALLNVLVGVLGSLGAAMLLNQRFAGTTVFRTFFFLPSITPIIASALLWGWIFQPTIGLLNYLLGQIGVEGPAWLQSSGWAIPSLVIISLWGSIGGSRMIVFLAGLQAVPQEMYEAAEIDGAGAWSQFVNITLPLISPTMFFNVVLAIIGSLSVFSLAYIATGGGPNYATYFYVYHLFKNAFEFSRMGYASAMAWIFLLIVMALTVLQFRLSNRWVYYAGAESQERTSDGR
ncbi:MAG TPA: sugar ABC transporter permease [Chloroflexota bacterium]|nr:sugar ABC transporter permease [Chloroflexota bacterium]